LKNATSKFMNASVPPFRIGLSGVHAVRVGAVIASALLLTGGAAEPVFAAAPSSTFRFALPGGAAILYGDASNPQAPLPERTWQQAVFHFPNGATFQEPANRTRVVQKLNRRARAISRRLDNSLSSGESNQERYRRGQGKRSPY
jgi:hypothetical protein